jgi:hypothetical protein
MPSTALPEISGLSKDRLDEVVASIKVALQDPDLRKLSQRAVQGKVWHLQPALAKCMAELRKQENLVRDVILERTSELVYKLHDQTLDTTLARAGLLEDERIHMGSSLDETKAFDLFCLDAKERLYLVLKQYGWLQEFFRNFPEHFYENSFQFVHRIPTKKLQVKVKVIGLGIGGSMAVSGLAKHGIESVVGYEKRDEQGPRRVGSRYQNASWRAYDIAERLLDDEAYQHLIAYRQRLNIQYDDGTSQIVTSDRVQIILGSAIEAALESAKRFGAELRFSTDIGAYFRDGGVDEPCDIVALFAGAHTSKLFPGLEEEMEIFSWPECSSACKMWLRVKESDRDEDFCTRGGEIGAEKWHYTIESARRTKEDVLRVRDNLQSQYNYALKKAESDEDTDKAKAEFAAKSLQIEQVLHKFEETENAEGVARFDYVSGLVVHGLSNALLGCLLIMKPVPFLQIFTNAPDNEHNLYQTRESWQGWHYCSGWRLHRRRQVCFQKRSRRF